MSQDPEHEHDTPAPGLPHFHHLSLWFLPSPGNQYMSSCSPAEMVHVSDMKHEHKPPNEEAFPFQLSDYFTSQVPSRSLRHAPISSHSAPLAESLFLYLPRPVCSSILPRDQDCINILLLKIKTPPLQERDLRDCSCARLVLEALPLTRVIGLLLLHLSTTDSSLCIDKKL